MENFVISMLIAATPLLLAATGELVAERSGVLNLGVEGMMLLGAVTAFATAFATGSSVLAVLAGAAAGLVMALIFAVIALSLLANQAATGLALTIFGIGASGLIGQGFVGQPIDPLAKLAIPGLSDASVLGRVLLGHDALVYLSLALALGVAWLLYRTRRGLALRAVGDNPGSAHALGYDVILTRYAATAFGGACAGLGGAYLSLAYTPMWGENMTAGRGWIALALVVFATWRPFRLIVGAYLFAAVTQLQFYGQDWGIQLPAQFLAMAPYLATILALVVISGNINLTKANAPASIGRPFRPER
jgi:simple sugar transport system permease protein